MIPPNHAPPDRRDVEIERLRRQLAQAQEREQKIREEERQRFSALSSASRRFATSMRSRLGERHRQQRRLDAQYAVSRILEESRDLREAGPEIFHALGLRLGWRVGVLWTVEAGSLRCDGLYRVEGDPTGGFGELCLASRFPPGAGLPGRVWRREEPCWVDDVLEDDGYPHQEAAAAEGLRCALAFPIQDGGRLIGVFELLKEEPSPEDEDVLRTVHLVGHQMGQFVERRWAEAERDRLLAREWVATAEAAERERISRELHDRVAHSMGVAHQSLQLYGVLAEKDPARAAERLDLAKEMVKASLESTRNLSAELKHLEAEDGLVAELRHLLDVSVPSHIGADLRVEGDEERVPGHVRGQIFLVLREAVRNAVSHSGGESISVALEIGRESIVGRVEDDGSGFDATAGNGGVGLRSMRERAALLDGALRLDRGPSRGTRVEVSVPLTRGS